MKEIPKIEIEDTIPQNASPEPAPNQPVSKRNKKKILLSVLLGLIGLGVLIGIPLLNVANKAKAVYRQGMVLKDSLKSKDLKQISKQIETTRKDLDSLKSAINILTPLRIIPFIGVYQSDAVHMVKAGEAGFDAAESVVKSVEPYADLLGLSGEAKWVVEKRQPKTESVFWSPH